MAEQENDNNKISKKSKIRNRTIIVLIALVLFVIGLGIAYRSNYVEMQEIGENYVDVFSENLKYKFVIGISNFIFIFITIFSTNKLIKKGLKKFFEEEKKEVPKLPNKSIALIFAILAAVITPNLFLEKIIFFLNNAQFGISEPVFNMDIGFYMFQAPLIEMILYYVLYIFIGVSIYTAVYYIVAFNIYFDGINGQTLKNGILIKQLFFNVIVLAIIVACLISLNTQNIILDNFMSINDTQKQN